MLTEFFQQVPSILLHQFLIYLVMNDCATSIRARSYPLKQKIPDFMIAALSSHVYRRNILSISSSTLSKLGIRLKLSTTKVMGFIPPTASQLGERLTWFLRHRRQPIFPSNRWSRCLSPLPPQQSTYSLKLLSRCIHRHNWHLR